MFQRVVQMAKDTELPEFNQPLRHITGEWLVPLELKVLMVFRTLGCGMKFLESSEMTQFMSYTTANTFFKKFCKSFREFYEHVHIKPLSGEEMVYSMKVYAALGLPLCVGSMDATFIPCEKLSSNLKNIADGDKGSGLLYQAVVDHCKRVLNVAGGCDGVHFP